MANDYDIAFVKKINLELYADLAELLIAYQNDMQYSIGVISNGLLEKGLKWFLEKEDMLDLFFDLSPNLSEIYFNNMISSKYIKSKLQIDDGIVLEIRRISNIKKHDFKKNIGVINKKKILREVFSFYVQLHNLYNNPYVNMPSEEYIDKLCSFNSDFLRLQDEFSLISERKEQMELDLLKTENEIKKRNDILIEKEMHIKDLNDCIKDKTTETLLINSETPLIQNLNNLGIEFLKKEDFLSAKKIFINLLNLNIMNVRAYIGIILCEYECKNIDILVEKLISKKVCIRELDIFQDAKKFLISEDYLILNDIANRIEIGILHNEFQNCFNQKEYEEALNKINLLKEIDCSIDYDSMINDLFNKELYALLENENFHEAKKVLLVLKSMNSDFDFKDLEEKIINNITYIDACSLLNSYKYFEAINLFDTILNFKDSSIKREQAYSLYMKQSVYTDDGFEISRDGKILYGYDPEKNKNDRLNLVVPKSVETIEGLFISSEKVESITILKNVKKINRIGKYRPYNTDDGIGYMSIKLYCGHKNNRHFFKIMGKHNWSEVHSDMFVYGKTTMYFGIEDVVEIGGNWFYIKDNKAAIYYVNPGVTNFKIPNKIELHGKAYPVEKIIGSAFEKCYSIKELTIPGSIKKIEASAFCWNFPYLSNIYYDGTIEDWCRIEFENMASNPMYNGGSFHLLNPEKGDGIYFKKYIKVTKITFPCSINKIGVAQFLGFKDLEYVENIGHVDSVGSYAFYGCSNLKQIELPNSLEYIPEHIFEKCQGLVNIKIPDTIKVIEKSAFSQCTNLCKVIIPKNVKNIESYAFNECTNLNTLIFEDESMLQTIESGVFYNCLNLSRVIIPKSVIKIGDDSPYRHGCFENCQFLKSVEFEDQSNLKFIGYYTFRKCINLTRISIPKTVEHLGFGCLSNCDSLESITTPIIEWIPRWRNPGHNYYFTYLFYYKNKYNDVAKGMPKNLKEIKIVRGHIGNGCFREYDNLVTVEVLDGCTGINGYAFYQCRKLENVFISSSITVIGERAFYYCNSLRKIELSKGVEVIGKSAFSGCHNLESISLSEGLLKIEDNAFLGCDKLKSITLPKSIVDVASTGIGINRQTIIHCDMSLKPLLEDKLRYNNVSWNKENIK